VTVLDFKAILQEWINFEDNAMNARYDVDHNKFVYDKKYGHEEEGYDNKDEEDNKDISPFS